MNTTTYRVQVEADSPGKKLLDALASVNGVITIEEIAHSADEHLRIEDRIELTDAGRAARAADLRVCRICGAAVGAGAMQRHHQLGDCCPLCNEVATRIDAQWSVDAKRHYDEMGRQFEQMVKDVRGGLTQVPTFYRGFE